MSATKRAKNTLFRLIAVQFLSGYVLCVHNANDGKAVVRTLRLLVLGVVTTYRWMTANAVIAQPTVAFLGQLPPSVALDRGS